MSGAYRVSSTLDLETTAATPAAAELGPVRPAERIAEMDILRGFALLGICVINLPGFYAPWSLEGSGAVELFPGRLDTAVVWLVNFLGSGKFNSMFSFLFGVGFAIQMDRAAARGAPFAGMYLRRLLTLLAFGLAHVAFLWDGDVLHLYAAIGLPLILVRKLPDRWLWAIAALCALLPVGHGLVKMARDEKPPRTAEQRLERGLEQLRIYGKGEYVIPRIDKDIATGVLKPPLHMTGESTYPRVVADRIGEWAFEYRHGAAWFWPIMGTTLVIGFIAGRRRFFQDIPGHLPIIRKITWWSGGIGLALAAAFATSELLAPRGGDRITALEAVASVLYILNRPILCAFYMGVIVLLAQRPVWRAALSPLASVGRMPLTNYLMQSVIASTLFFGYAFGLFYRIGPAVGVLIAFAIYAAQVAYSAWWMARFRFGPMEWLWRTLTYGRAPVMLAPNAPSSIRAVGSAKQE
jgi:uncharacterized protein